MGMRSEACLCPVLIGRGGLVEHAGRRTGEMLDGAGGMLFLAGEAGIGKTRLLAEIVERAAARGARIARAGAFPRDAEVAGGLLLGLTTSLGPLGHPAGALAERFRGAVTGGSADGTRWRRLLVHDAADALVAADEPLVIALEDLHWADELSLDVLDRAAPRLRTAPVLVVATYRSDELFPHSALRTWRTRLLTGRAAEELRLPRLDRDATARMVAAILGSVPGDRSAAALFERSDGIPLHVEELLAAAGADGAGPCQSTAPTVRLPDTLADAVLGRSRELSEDSLAVAAAAATIGRRFDVDLLTAVTGTSPEHVDAALQVLRDRFFVSPGADGTGYDFRHALIRDALYDALPPHRRRFLHARVADAARDAGFGDAFLSDHYERAHQHRAAFTSALAAARHATAMSAHVEATALYRRARRTMPADTPDDVRGDLLTALSIELIAIDDVPGAEATLTDAYAHRLAQDETIQAAKLVPALVTARHRLGADLGYRVGLLREGLRLIDERTDTTAEHVRARLLAAMSAVYMFDRRLDESLTHGEAARALATALGDDRTRWSVDATIAPVLLFAGRMDEGWELADSTIAETLAADAEPEASRAYQMVGSSAAVLVEYDAADRYLDAGIAYAERTEQFGDRNYMLAMRARVQWATGAWADARPNAERALADFGDTVLTRILALQVLGFLAIGRGDGAAAREHLDAAYGVGTELREVQRLSPTIWGLAELALRGGDTVAARARCEEGLAASEQVGDAAYLFPFVVTGVRAYLADNDPTRAHVFLGRCATLLEKRSIPGTLPALDHAEGLLHLHEGQTGKARVALEAAGAEWDRRRQFWEGTQALLDQARCAHRSRRPADATALARTARDRATSAGAVVLTGAADDLLAAIGTREPSGPPGLTPREIEVARHIAAGATNREIATALTISPKTVAAHVEHILTKLRATRRTQIASWVHVTAARSDADPPDRTG
ncbi:ATP-binding protein [Cryptosporangium arvum]|uniref:Transcriptional regulator, luxR family n=1 Tax=Cryptosporangium arvum DSM 44712 TaxID=927661 RepID=A0A010YP28_9ACTN|nr:LuxR family transcriptional regulator [Cryptosporangium arvum]EXG81935.1 transcriptional regulator, luxR family [Cryptosporangium arvum DSM 44712]